MLKIVRNLGNNFEIQASRDPGNQIVIVHNALFLILTQPLTKRTERRFKGRFKEENRVV